MTIYKGTIEGVAQHSFKDFYTPWKSGTLPDLFLERGKAEPKLLGISGLSSNRKPIDKNQRVFGG